jgi:hypothetical protein
LGGSGEAIARGQLERGFGENVASTVGALMAAGYDKATAVALANAQMQQQTGLANQAAENTMRTTGADYGLKSGQVNDQFRTSQQARELAAQLAIMQGGGQQQAFGQRALDVPWTMLERLLALTPRQMNSQTISQKESPDNSASPLQSLLGFGTSILGAKTAGGGSIAASLLGISSDEDEKTNIKKLGKDPETGLEIYAYDYKSDVEAARRNGSQMPPKRTGPMAQDIERARPGSTREVGGSRIVPASMLQQLINTKAA